MVIILGWKPKTFRPIRIQLNLFNCLIDYLVNLTVLQVIPD